MRFEIILVPPKNGFKHDYIAQWRDCSAEEIAEIKEWAAEAEHYCFNNGRYLWTYPYDDEDAVLFSLRWG